MTKEIKDMTQEELKKLFAEKNTELFQLAKKIDEGTDFDILVFSLIGVATEDDTSSSNAIYGSTIGLANLLNHEEDYHKIANIIQIHKLKNILGINDEEEQE
ncbi:DUF2482 family protein [Staphylococcus hominis]